MAPERISKLQKQILKTISEISRDFRERGFLKKEDVYHDSFPSLSISGYLISKVSDKYYDGLLSMAGVGARFLKNVVITRKANVAILRSLRNLYKKGFVVLYEISGEVRLTKEGEKKAQSIKED
ncbi:MAG: hypothetical protein ABIA97_02060 [Candidatus Omnitrophota bacterium]